MLSTKKTAFFVILTNIQNIFRKKQFARGQPETHAFQIYDGLYMKGGHS